MTRRFGWKFLGAWLALLLGGGSMNTFAADATPLPPTPAHSETIVLGMGCFWGAEKRLAAIPGVISTEVGYAGGDAKEVNYKSIFTVERAIESGQSHTVNAAEVVKVTYDPAKVPLQTILATFWQSHDPTQGNRQGNDVGSNYRSAIFFTTPEQKTVAVETEKVYQAALTKAGYGKITTEIAPLQNYNRAEDYHQDYLEKHPDGYCGLGGTGVPYPQAGVTATSTLPPPLDPATLNADRQLIVFEAPDCPFCERFKKEVLSDWHSPVPVVTTLNPNPPKGWVLEKALFATPTIVLFEHGKEVSRYTGYSGDKDRFWKWLGFYLLSPEQRKIAFDKGTEAPGTGSHLDEQRPGTYVDPITGAPLFRSDAKFHSGTGWPSFFNPVPGAIELRTDDSYGMHRVEVISASSGIHLGHVFDDGPPPSGKRYCINGDVLKFIPDAPAKKP